MKRYIYIIGHQRDIKGYIKGYIRGTSILIPFINTINTIILKSTWKRIFHDCSILFFPNQFIIETKYSYSGFRRWCLDEAVSPGFGFAFPAWDFLFSTIEKLNDNIKLLKNEN